MGEKAIYFSPTGGVKTVAEILCNDLIDYFKWKRAEF